MFFVLFFEREKLLFSMDALNWS